MPTPRARVLIGAHVSPAGGPAKAIERGQEMGARSIQIFSQNPRAWKPTRYSEEQVAAYHEALQASQVDALLIHAVYLLNPASDDPDFQEKTLASLTTALQVGEALGATGVVLHPGSAKTGDVGEAIDRAGVLITEALKESGSCPLQLENTAGAGGTLGRSFEELARLLEACGGGERLGVCLDSCHMLASGFDVRSAKSLSAVLDDFDRIVGLDRLQSLHLNDSQTPLGSNRDRHASVGEGEIGRKGCAAFLSEPRFEGLACVLETPGPDKKGPWAAELRLCEELRAEGLKARSRAKSRAAAARKR